MFRVLDVSAEGCSATQTDTNLVALPPDGVVRWIDLEAPNAADLELLRERFQFHPLALANCAHHDRRPKLDEFSNHLFIVTQGLNFTENASTDEAVEVLELHAFLGHNYLVTVHATTLDPLEQTWLRCSHSPSPLARGADFGYYLVADALIDLGFPLLDNFTDQISEIEETMLERPSAEDLRRIFELRRHLVNMRRVIAPQREIVALLSRREAPQISERTSLYLRDLTDHLVRLTESIDLCRERLNGAFEAYVSAASMRTNDIMKSLTLLSAVFLPLTFIVGFFGQNFDSLPLVGEWMHSRALGAVMAGACALTPPAMYLWFRAKEWI